MKISEIKSYITPKTTGYAAATGIVLSALSGKSRNRTFRKMHKPIACATVLSTAIHVGLIEYNNYKWKQQKTGK